MRQGSGDRPGAAAETEPLSGWIERQGRFSAQAMLRAISATHLVKERPGFHQRIVPKEGSVLASPELASYDPDPDYFFHWFRDSALVMDALRVLIETGDAGLEGTERYRAFLRFSRDLAGLHGADAAGDTGAGPPATPDFQQFVRPAAELRAVAGERVMADTRVNPDGTIDTIRWTRPQYDGPALRALTLLRYWPMPALSDASTRAVAADLIGDDLAFTARLWNEPAFDIWEEESGHHYYTRLVQAAALESGAAWLQETGESREAQRYAGIARQIGQTLDEHWSEERGYLVSRLGVTGSKLDKSLDFATILAVLHAGRPTGPHSVMDPRVQATLARLEDLFEAEFPINRHRPASQAPALGRYPGDVYYGGGPFYFCILGAAEFHYALAKALLTSDAPVPPGCGPFFQRTLAKLGEDADGFDLLLPGARRRLAAALVRRGDMSFATVRAHTPPSGELSEQFDRDTGAQTSARNLTWSYASFITAAAARAGIVPLLN